MATPEETLQAFVGPGERLLWSGRGGVGVREVALETAVLAFAVGATIVGAFAATEPFGRLLGYFDGKSGIAVVAVAGLIPAVLIVPFWVLVLNRFTAYGLTEGHLVWVRSSPFRFRRKLRLSDIRDITRTDLRNGRSNLLFVTIPQYEPETGRLKTVEHELHSIRDAAALEALIQERRRHSSAH